MNEMISLLILPFLAAFFTFVIRQEKVRAFIARFFSISICACSIFIIVRYFHEGISININNTEIIDILMLAIDILIAVYIIFAGFKHKKYFAVLFSVTSTVLLVWFELEKKSGIKTEAAFVIDKLAMIMILIVGIVGSMICLYAVGYMRDYHNHHKEYKNRTSFFLSVMFFFLAAMFGIVISNSLSFMLFFWELTTLCSYLLIGYTQTEEAISNAFHALTINLGGGLCFVIALIFVAINYHTLEISTLVTLNPNGKILIPVFFLSLAALTKSAQLPFSSWLLGAMVAPTPSSALLHSATMVKAGVFLLIRISPLLGDSSVGKTVTLVGGITFLVMSLICITQSDGKKVLAYSTIANLGLIVTCASVNTPESLWAAILLIIFHAVSKSLLFMCVGSAEHQLGSRDIEEMDLLLSASPAISICMVIGIAGMFLAPFGMLISKWMAMKAFVDSGNVIFVIILAYGSAATLFYWTKWMGKLVTHSNRKDVKKYKLNLDEKIPIYFHTIMTVLSCLTFPFISEIAIRPFLETVYGRTINPIGTTDIVLMLTMLSMLIILPISFIPLYKNDTRRIAPIYMAGENTGDNLTFHAALGTEKSVEMHNWYLTNLFANTKVQHFIHFVAIIILIIGFASVMMGVAI